MSACLVFVFAALVEYAMVNVYARRRFGQLRPPLALPLSTMVVRSINQSIKVFYSGLSNLNHC